MLQSPLAAQQRLQAIVLMKRHLQVCAKTEARCTWAARYVINAKTFLRLLSFLPTRSSSHCLHFLPAPTQLILHDSSRQQQGPPAVLDTWRIWGPEGTDVAAADPSTRVFLPPASFNLLRHLADLTAVVALMCLQTHKGTGLKFQSPLTTEPESFPRHGERCWPTTPQ